MSTLHPFVPFVPFTHSYPSYPSPIRTLRKFVPFVNSYIRTFAYFANSSIRNSYIRILALRARSIRKFVTAALLLNNKPRIQQFTFIIYHGRLIVSINN